EVREWLRRRFKRRLSSQCASEDISDGSHHQLLKDIELDCTFFEHTLTMEQLNDLFPLSRICLQDARRTRGLNKDEVIARLSKDGRNIVCPVTGKDALKIFLAQFLNTFRIFLLLVALMCFAIFLIDTEHLLELYLMLILLGVFLALSLISYWQERSAYTQVRGFKSMVPTFCVVVRSGRHSRVNASEIVVGDVVYLSSGSRVPADLRLIYTDGLFLETSWISGEMDPLEFYDESVGKGVSALASQNIAFNGCQCVRGEALGIVIKTGNDTVIGKLMEMTSKEGGQPTRLEREHKRFVTFITVLALVVGAITFLIGVIVNNFQRITATFVNGFLVISVANVPQGLPITLGAALIIVARRLAKKGLYMKRLDVAETLGTATVVMCDKRGVFTSNDIAVTDIWHGREFFKGRIPIINRRRYSWDKLSSLHNSDEHACALLTAMSVCNKAQVEPIGSGNVAKWKQITFDVDLSNMNAWTSALENGSTQLDLEQNATQRAVQLNSIRAAFQHKNITGNPTEVALLKYVEESIRKKFEIVFEIPFDATRRFHVVVAKSSNESETSEEGVVNHFGSKSSCNDASLDYSTLGEEERELCRGNRKKKNFRAPKGRRMVCVVKEVQKASVAFHLWMCTTRRISLFQHGFRNIVAAFAILLEILALNFFIYTPGLQAWLGVEHPPAFVWLFCFGVAAVLLVFNESENQQRVRNAKSTVTKHGGQLNRNVTGYIVLHAVLCRSISTVAIVACDVDP
ncbi:Sodium/potassium-transporting ATPase subunit alpha-1, partial [Toxocara canis]